VLARGSELDLRAHEVRVVEAKSSEVAIDLQDISVMVKESPRLGTKEELMIRSFIDEGACDVYWTLVRRGAIFS
jgi:hypothetical protein